MPETTLQEALNDAMREEMRRDDRVFCLGLDIGAYGGLLEATDGLIDEFGPERVLDTPISEAVIAGAAVGAAVDGMVPVAEIQHIDWITIALDSIVNHGAFLSYSSGGQVNVPMVIRTQGGSHTLGAQHSKSLEAWLTHVPGLKVIMPSTPADAKGLLKAAIRDPNPVIFIEHKLNYRRKGEVPDGDFVIEIGKADIKREGTDVTVVATSISVHEALAAADELAKDGISVEVLDPRTLVPLDIDAILSSVRKTAHLVVVHEAWKTGGFGGEIVSQVCELGFDALKAPPVRLGAADTPNPYSPALEPLAIPRRAQIEDAVRKLVAH